MLNLSKVGERIKIFREKANLTQARVAEYLSLDQSMIAKMEKGERTINSDVIEKLSFLYCCPVDYILHGDKTNLNSQISFRTNTLNKDDLKSLSLINKMVLNQFEMDKILGECDD